MVVSINHRDIAFVVELSEMTNSIIQQFREKFRNEVNLGLLLDRDKVEQFLIEAVEKAKTDTLDFVSDKQGWEDSRNLYAKMLGIPERDYVAEGELEREIELGEVEELTGERE